MTSQSRYNLKMSVSMPSLSEALKEAFASKHLVNVFHATTENRTKIATLDPVTFATVFEMLRELQELLRLDVELFGASQEYLVEIRHKNFPLIVLFPSALSANEQGAERSCPSVTPCANTEVTASTLCSRSTFPLAKCSSVRAGLTSQHLETSTNLHKS